jgi:hypothetical protein
MASLMPVEPVLLRAFENEVASAVVSAVGFIQVAKWSHVSVPPLPSDVDIAPGAMDWALGWDRVDGLFPLVVIEYLEAGDLHQVQAWADVSDEAEEIIKFEANPVNKREYRVTVTATGTEMSGGVPVPATAVATYTVQILQQYNTNKDRLKEVVDARR